MLDILCTTFPPPTPVPIFIQFICRIPVMSITYKLSRKHCGSWSAGFSEAKKPADLDLHYFQIQDISGFSI